MISAVTESALDSVKDVSMGAHKKTLRRDDFSATKVVLPFSLPRRSSTKAGKTHEAIFPNRNAASVAETEIDAANFPAHTWRQSAW